MMQTASISSEETAMGTRTETMSLFLLLFAVFCPRFVLCGMKSKSQLFLLIVLWNSDSFLHSLSLSSPLVAAIVQNQVSKMQRNWMGSQRCVSFHLLLLLITKSGCKGLKRGEEKR